MKRIYLAFLIIFILSFALNIIGYGDDRPEEDYFDIQVITSNPNLGINKVTPKIGSRAIIAMDTITGRVLYEKNAYTERPMASTTKIMTAILAIEKGKSNDIVVVSSRAAGVGGSSAHLVKGEKIRLGELLYGLMLPSGNDAAIAIAEHIGGSVENFAAMMTAKAREIGACNTAFVTPHGLDRDGHYTTAYDLALITRYALRNKTFSQLVGTQQTSISGFGNGSRALRNTNEMLWGYPGADGVKTGYTGKAGRCLVTSATRNNWRIISVVLGSDTRNQRAADSANVLDYIYNNYKIYDLNTLKSLKTSVMIKKGREAILKISIEDKILLPLNKEEKDQLNLRFDIPKYITAPIGKGTKIGTAVYSIGTSDCKLIDLFAGKTVYKKNVMDYFGEIYEIWVKESRFSIINYLI